VDAVFDAGTKEADPEKRTAIYLEVQKILLDEVPVAWLYEITFPTLYRSKISNLISSSIGLNDSLGTASIKG
jgi:peptide/nickel transport system substrate-binding protein